MERFILHDNPNVYLRKFTARSVLNGSQPPLGNLLQN